MSRTQSLLAVAIAVLSLSCLTALTVAQTAAGNTYSSPRAWPFRHMQLGLMNGPGEAGTARAQAPVAIRYQYLSGGVNTGSSWQNWAEGGLTYVKQYISESEHHHLLPVFSYYQLRQSLPGADMSDESQADMSNLADVSTMKSYYEDLTQFFKAAASAHGSVVLHFEPDAFGYIERAARHNDAATVPAAVASTGVRALRGLPNNASGWARAVIRLRNDYAPNVIVAYALSIWGTDKDIHLSHPSVRLTKRMAKESAAFYRSLHAKFNMVFTEVGNQDAGEVQTEEGNRSAWWKPVDYARDAEYLADLHNKLHEPIVIWQIPIGNTVMRAMNDTPYHWQDNHVQWYLGTRSREHLEQLAKAGVVALLFGSPQPEGTSALATGETGARNPHAIDGNNEWSSSADDDGGYFMNRANDYYNRHMLKVAG